MSSFPLLFLSLRTIPHSERTIWRPLAHNKWTYPPSSGIFWKTGNQRFCMFFFWMYTPSRIFWVDWSSFWGMLLNQISFTLKIKEKEVVQSADSGCMLVGPGSGLLCAWWTLPSYWSVADITELQTGAKLWSPSNRACLILPHVHLTLDPNNPVLKLVEPIISHLAKGCDYKVIFLFFIYN